jgi:hypothetical protein
MWRWIHHQYVGLLESRATLTLHVITIPRLARECGRGWTLSWTVLGFEVVSCTYPSIRVGRGVINGPSDIHVVVNLA